MSKKKKSKGKLALKIIGIFFIVLALFVGITTLITVIGDKANTEKARSFNTVKYENQLVPEKDSKGNWTFTTDRDFKVVQITDVHIGGGWMSLRKDGMALNAVAAMVTAEKPDLVVVTGDIGYPVPFQSGTFNNKLSAKIFAELMEKLGVYWTLGFGNHDTEAYSYYTRADISDFYSSDDYKYCLFQRGPENISGYGNQVINVKKSNGVLSQSIYVLDSHSYTDGDWFGVMWKYDNIHQDQVDWYKKSVEYYNSVNAETYKKLGLKADDTTVKSTMYFHIPLTEYRDAWYEFADNDFKDTENVKLIYGTAGEGKKVVYPGIGDDNLFETIQELGSTKGVFCGHDHKNNFSVDYKGIRLTYGMSVDYLAYPGIYKLGSQRGCTVIELSPDGSFDCHQESYYQDKYTSQYKKENVTMQEVVPIEPVTEK